MVKSLTRKRSAVNTGNGKRLKKKPDSNVDEIPSTSLDAPKMLLNAMNDDVDMTEDPSIAQADNAIESTEVAGSSIFYDQHFSLQIPEAKIKEMLDDGATSRFSTQSPTQADDITPISGCEYRILQSTGNVMHTTDTRIDRPVPKFELKHLKKNLASNISIDDGENGGKSKNIVPVSPKQQQVLSLMLNYRDLLYPLRSLEAPDDVRLPIALHTLNHVLWSRTRILGNNTKLKADADPGSRKNNGDGDIDNDDQTNGQNESKTEIEDCTSVTDALTSTSSLNTDRNDARKNNNGNVILPTESPGALKVGKPLGTSSKTIIPTLTDPEELECRDQGLTKPKVLILVPFRNSAFRIVNHMIALMFGGSKPFVEHRARFIKHFGPSAQADPHTPKPSDYRARFAGNIDDNFKIGLKLAKKSLGLYVDFYRADVLIASPLGLRMAMGTEGDKAGMEADFLSSIEVVMLDEAEVFLMQNWSHLLHIMDHLNCLPKRSHGVDFSRVRLPYLDGGARLYRQTIIASGLLCPEIRAIFGDSGVCSNYAGGTVVSANMADPGTISKVIPMGLMDSPPSLPQAFQRFRCSDPAADSDARFDFFVNKILPEYKASMPRTLIFIPSYLDFVRVRNALKRDPESPSWVQICEYTEKKKITRARDHFFHGEAGILLFTERFHFYRRYRIKGARHIVFYQLPLFSEFYPEMCNCLSLDTESETETAAGGNNEPDAGCDADQSPPLGLTCTVLYSAFDAYRLAGVVGRERARKLLASEKGFHLLISGGAE